MENAENSVLSGNDNRLFGSQLADLFTGRNPRGGSVELTLNKAAQDAAYNGMRNPDGTFRRGAVVALDPTTGAILAVVSTPSYDPNKLSTHSAASNSRYYASLQPKKGDPNPANPLLNRAFNQLYAPGRCSRSSIPPPRSRQASSRPTRSPLRTPTGRWSPSARTACPANLQAACVENFEGETCQNGTTATLAFALAKSCNTAFAQLAVEKLGAQADPGRGHRCSASTAKQLDTPLGVSRSTIGTDKVLADKAALAQTSFGQRDVRITPLQGAMISAAVANGGTLMKPYLVQKELGPNLSVLTDTNPSS